MKVRLNYSFFHNKVLTFETDDPLKLFISKKKFFLGPQLRHMEVPRLGVELDLHLLAFVIAIATQYPSCVCDLH